MTGEALWASSWRRVAVIVGGVLALGAVAWWIWVATVWSTPPVRSELLGFSVATPTSVAIQFSVTRDPGVSVACVLRARGADGSEVGRLQVLVPPDDRELVDLTRTVRTIRPAVTGEVVGCQPYEPPSGPDPADP